MASFRSEAEAFPGIVWHGRRSCQVSQRPETPGFRPGSGSFILFILFKINYSYPEHFACISFWIKTFNSFPVNHREQNYRYCYR